MSTNNEIYQKACKLIPGGVNSPVRSFKSVGGYPMVASHAAGTHIWDVDGKQYTDYVLSWGPMIFGHADRHVEAAVEAALRRGTSFGLLHEEEVRYAELFTRLVPEVEMLRLVNSGTEATMSAIRLARGATGRKLLVKFTGCYHGHGDSLLVQAGSGVATLGIPGSPGIPEEIASLTVSLPFNDAEALEQLLREHGDDVAAIILETLPGNMGLVRPDSRFLDAVQSAQKNHGVILIADEVMSGFRAEKGAAFRAFGLQPDLTTWGKVIGAGLPLAAYAGSRELMEHMAPVGNVYQAGTLSGNPLAVAAGIAVMEKLLQERPWESLGAWTAAFVQQVRELAAATGKPVVADGCGAMFGMFFAHKSPQAFSEVVQADHARYARFFHFAMQRGVLLAPSGYEAAFVSTLHTDADRDELLHILKDFLAEDVS